MSDQDLFEEAEICRRRALAHVGQAEASFLLRVAAALDDVARKIRTEFQSNSSGAPSSNQLAWQGRSAAPFPRQSSLTANAIAVPNRATLEQVPSNPSVPA